MTFTVSMMRAVGMTEKQINDLLGLEQQERIQREREKSRIRKQKQRSGHALPRDPRDGPLTYLSSSDSNTEDSIQGGNAHARSKRGAKPLEWLSVWKPNDAHYQIGCGERGFSRQQLDIQAEKYRDWNRNAKKPHKDPDAGFRNWLRSELQSRSNGNGYGRRHGSVLDATDRIESILKKRGAEEGYIPGSSGPRSLYLDQSAGKSGVLKLPKR